MERKRILVVDDEERFAKFVKAALERTGAYEVRTETEAKRALATALAFKPDLIFMDVAMPELDGGDVAAQLSEKPTLKGVPIIFLTGAASSHEVSEGGGVIGGREFLAKPVSISDLTAAVERHLGPLTAA
ncbi:MAG: response regulator [Deltaproteobacteria bacterium]|nr:response regulator [Deltaproteobacteria bacterium]